MVGTRRRRAQEEKAVEAAVAAGGASDESDDEAPEEVSLATGKQSAAQRRQEEAEAKAAARAAAKEKRTAQQERQRAAKAERKAAVVEAASEEAAASDSDAQHEDDGEAQEEGKELDLLPDDVLAALAGNKRTVPTGQQARLISEQLRRRPDEPLLALGQPQRKQVVEREVGPVMVRMLSAAPASQPSQSARDFLQQRLQAGVKRSTDMLKPVRSLQPARVAQQQWRQAATPAAGGAKRRR